MSLLDDTLSSDPAKNGGAPDRSSQLESKDAPSERTKDDGDAVKIKIAGHLISYALQEYTLLQDQRGQPYAAKKEGPTNIAVPLDSLRHPLAARYYDEMGAPASTSAWPEASQTLQGLALREARQTIYMRHGHVGGNGLAIDLGRQDGHCVLVNGSGWRIVGPDEIPVKFRRPDGMIELPEPKRGKTLDDLRRQLGREPIEWALILAWAISALRVDTPCPLLHLMGEQGSGKSVLANALIALVDPGAPLGRPPGNEERLQNAAYGSRVYGIDNLTHIQPWLSDGLCAIVTGERERRRKLYTDATAYYLEIKSAVIITGISLTGAGPDLLERMLAIQLNKIDAGARREEIALLRAIAEARPEHFASLLDMTAEVIAYIAENDPPPNLPRMADFARVVHALDMTGNTSGAFAHYVEVAPIVSAYEALDSTDFGSDLFRWLETALPEAQEDGGPPDIRSEWSGTMSELLNAVAWTRFADSHGNLKIPSAGQYPHNPRGAASALRRLAPALRVLGIEWVPPPSSGRSHTRKTTLRRVAETPEVRDAQ